jgi:nucleotide-binding universal stress UspA family protein
MIPQHAVVVGVDGSATAWTAFRWAADEAERTGRPLVVAHAGDTESSAEQPSFGRELLDDAVTRLAEADSHAPVVTKLRAGRPEELLAALGSGADLVVVGVSGAGRLARLIL